MIPAERPETFSTYRDAPLKTCLRCGKPLPERDYLTLDDGGRPRQWCSDACRRAASRLRKSRGDRWWQQQPWYPAWAAAREEWLAAAEERERQLAEHRKLVSALPREARQGFDEARRAEEKRHFSRIMLAMALDTFRIEFERKHRRRIADFGCEIRLVDLAESKVEKLLRQAVRTDNEHEAMAMFAQARKMVAAGAPVDDDPVSVMRQANNALRDVFGMF